MVGRRRERLINLIQFSGLFLIALLISACGTHTFHQVRPNDTLYSISWNYNQDYKQVAKWNGLAAPYVVKPGQWIRVAPPTRDAWGRLHPPLPEPRPAKTVQVKAPATEVAAKRPPPPPAKTVVASQPTPASPVLSRSTAMPEWIWPSKGKVIQAYNAKRPRRQGIDIAASLGEKVLATSGGKVVYSGNGLRGYGNLIIIKHNAKYLSAYAHNQRRVVKEGDMVKKGQVIAYAGQTESDRVKLHFQIRIDGKPVDPIRYLPK